MNKGNLYSDALPPATGERFDTLVRHKNLMVERIVSSSTITPREYVQSQDEWVVLVKGEAIVRVGDQSVAMAPGDYLFLPAGMPHSVEHVSQAAIWLAVHLYPRPGEAADNPA